MPGSISPVLLPFMVARQLAGVEVSHVTPVSPYLSRPLAGPAPRTLWVMCSSHACAGKPARQPARQPGGQPAKREQAAPCTATWRRSTMPPTATERPSRRPHSGARRQGVLVGDSGRRCWVLAAPRGKSKHRGRLARLLHSAKGKSWARLYCLPTAKVAFGPSYGQRAMRRLAQGSTRCIAHLANRHNCMCSWVEAAARECLGIRPRYIPLTYIVHAGNSSWAYVSRCLLQGASVVSLPLSSQSVNLPLSALRFPSLCLSL